MEREIIFKLGEMLLEEKEKYYKNVKEFSEAINLEGRQAGVSSGKAGNSGKGGSKKSVDKIEYRKLGRFLKDVNNASFVFSVSELRAFDRYFSQRDQSLCTVPIFYRKESMVDYLAENNEMTFAVATRYQVAARTDTVSRWDLRAMNLLFNKGAFDHIEVEDVFHHGSDYAAIGKDRWNHSFATGRSSIVSFGSPFACHATERMLAAIFAVEAYHPPADDPEEGLPLYFFWKGKANRQNVDSSAFMPNRRQTPKLYAKHSSQVRKLGKHERAIFVGDQCYASHTIGESYGLFVAQRQDKDRIYATIIGTYGPDTYAVAKCLSEDEIVGELPRYDGRYKGGQPVFIAVIKTHISVSGESKDRETREISQAPKVCHSELWEMDGQKRWRSSNAKPPKASPQPAN